MVEQTCIIYSPWNEFCMIWFIWKLSFGIFYCTVMVLLAWRYSTVTVHLAWWCSTVTVLLASYNHYQNVIPVQSSKCDKVQTNLSQEAKLRISNILSKIAPFSKQLKSMDIINLDSKFTNWYPCPNRIYKPIKEIKKERGGNCPHGWFHAKPLGKNLNIKKCVFWSYISYLYPKLPNEAIYFCTFGINSQF